MEIEIRERIAVITSKTLKEVVVTVNDLMTGPWQLAGPIQMAVDGYKHFYTATLVPKDTPPTEVKHPLLED